MRQPQQEKGKKKDAVADADDDAASEQGSDDGEAADGKKPKEKTKGKEQGKKKEGKDSKDGKDGKAGKEKIESPPLYPATPYYGHPYPNLSDIRPILEQPGWNLEQSLLTARRADEEYIGRWLMEKGSPFQLGAMNWLEEREKRRREQITYPFPSGAGKQVAFAQPPNGDRPFSLPPFG